MLIKQTSLLTLHSAKVNGFLGLLFAGCLLGATPAAAINSHQETIKVRINPDELNSASGVENIYKLLEKKAQFRCTSAGYRPLSVKRYEEYCTAELLESLVEDLDHPGVHTLHLHSQ